MYEHYNANPAGRNVDDCTIRAISTATGDSWDAIHADLCDLSRLMRDMPSGNEVWWEYLVLRGWVRRFLPNDCPMCYTLADFCREYPSGVYIVGLEGHVVCVWDGTLLDTWDSSGRRPLFYWQRG